MASRPRALVVGGLPGIRSPDGLDFSLELHRAGPQDAVKRLASTAFDIVLLDGSLPVTHLEAVLGALPPSGVPERPALLVVTAGAARPQMEPRILGDAGDFLNGDLGQAELLGRVETMLRFRLCLAELSRKNAELESLYGRLESISRRTAEELRLASKVQRSLLPPQLHHPRLEMAREFIPFREIGGDYYDVVPVGPSRLAFAIGDVMGKGIPAALLAANLKASLRAQLQAGEPAPQEVVARVNRLFWEVTPKGLFASLFFAVFDLEVGCLDYVNAGHDYPFRIHGDSTIQELDQGGTVLGLMEDARYESGRLALHADDLLVFYSDGVTDRANVEGELYGLERLKDAAVRSRRDGARIALYTLLGDVQGWSSGTAAEDDMTLVVMKVH